MPHIYTLHQDADEIFVVDYTGSKEAQMMQLATKFRELIQTRSKPVLVMAVFNDSTYVTPTFMRHAEKESGAVMPLLEKVAFVGLSTTKKIILQGYNILFGRSFQAFDTQEEAIRFLVDRSASDKRSPF
ncbi:hypothetical protein [Chryseolinea soli]|uniref:STAS/SEC14 domain-containing protein n=1 Tax=Chryseolinea soli TaxID=2321403 RepID=A0A385SUT6_9BACT|nr:hypothetical protein [Chryseolinea soli]AYB33897.1 hypothetical protein D4L85_26440 [Chryseolinea soli]